MVCSTFLNLLFGMKKGLAILQTLDTTMFFNLPVTCEHTISAQKAHAVH